MRCTADCVTSNPARWCADCREAESGADARGADALPRGTRVGSFALGRVLGAGGQGITYLAFDEHLGTWRVVKEFFPSDLASREMSTRLSVRPKSRNDVATYERALEQFADEARTLARLQHPHVVPVTQYIPGNGTAYFAMPYFEGETVEARHAKRLLSYCIARRVTQNEAAMLWSMAEVEALLSALVSALSFLHKRTPPLLHRDVKPGNLFMAADASVSGGERLLLIDFGAAREVLGQSRVSRLYTRGFAPPEQVSGFAQSPATNTYAAAATTYFLLTNRTPAAAQSLIAHPSSLVKTVPQDLGNTIMACLADRAAERPTLDRLLQAVRTAIETSPGEATSRGARTQFARDDLPSPKRNLLLAGVVSAALVLLVAVSLIMSRGPRTELQQTKLQPRETTVGGVVPSMRAMALTIGESLPITAEARTNDGAVIDRVPIAWQAEDTTVVRVSSSGQVRAVGVGTTQIVATADGRSARVPVTVRARNKDSVQQTAPVKVSDASERATGKTAAEVRTIVNRMLTAGSYRAAADTAKRYLTGAVLQTEIARVRAECTELFYAEQGQINSEGARRPVPPVCAF